MPLKVQTAAKTDIGKVRRSNQDSLGSDDECGLYVVCDGMGGAAGGELASSIAVEAFLSTARQELLPLRSLGAHVIRVALQRAAASANRAVGARAAWDTRYRGMGCTLVAASISGAGMTILNVGDSRAYLFRYGGVLQLTEDHSLVAEQVRLGRMSTAQAERSSLQSIITRAIGIDADVHPDLYTQALQAGDTLLLTSDGLTRHVQQEELCCVVAESGAQPLDEVCQKLIDLANQRGGSDNITCMMIRVLEATGQVILT